MATIHEVLSSESPGTGLGVLLSVLSSAAAGNDVSVFLPDIIQGVFAKPSPGNAHIRKLAYDICKCCALTDKDTARLLAAAKVRHAVSGALSCAGWWRAVGH